MKKIKTLQIEHIFDSLLDRLAKAKWQQHGPVQIYSLQKLASFKTKQAATGAIKRAASLYMVYPSCRLLFCFFYQRCILQVLLSGRQLSEISHH